MIFAKICAAIIFFLLGLIYLFKPDTVLNLNRLARDVIFNDRIILLRRKKLAVLFFCLAFIAVYMSFSSLNYTIEYENEKRLSNLKSGHLMYLAMQDYYGGRFDNALDKYKAVLKSDPSNLEVLKRIAFTYLASGNRKKAGETLQRLSTIAPEDKEIKQSIKELSNENNR